MRTGLIASGLCALVAVGCAREPASVVVGISTEEPGPTIAAAMQPLLAQEGIELDIRAFEDPEAILAAVLDGRVDLGIIEEPARRIAELRTVAPLYPSILHAMHRRERVVSTFAELIRGQQIYAGPVGGTAWRLLKQLAADFEVADGDYTILPDPWRVEPDVYFILGGLLAPESLDGLVGYAMYSFGSPDRLGYGTAAEGLALKYPNIRPFILPDSVYGSFNAAPILTLATRTVLVARHDLNPNLTYLIARQLFEQPHEIADEYHLVMTELHDRLDPNLLSLPLHSGSRFYVNKDQPSLLERYAEVVGVGLAIVVALASGLAAVARMRKARKKDRIDVFYRRVLEIRHELVEKNLPKDFSVLEDKLKTIQEEVLALLIAEQLNVDESLTLFLDLSNRVLGEIAAQRAALDAA